MAARKPLVLVGGSPSQLPASDSLDAAISGLTFAAPITQDTPLVVGNWVKRGAGAYALAQANSEANAAVVGAIVAVVGGAGDNYTKLLLHCDGTNGSTSFPDSSLLGHVATAHGSAAVSTAQYVFGGASGKFNCIGTDYLSVADSVDWTFGSGAFTIDFRVRFTATSGASLFSLPLDSNNELLIFQNTSGHIHARILLAGSIVIDLIGSNVLATDTWYHVALVRNGTGFALYLDGSSVDSGTLSDALFDPSEARVGYTLFNGSFSAHDAWIDEVRISKGIARWTSNFVPPVSAYVVSAAGQYTICTGGRTLAITGTDGSQYYLSPTTAGAMTATKPSTLGQVVKPLFIADDAGGIVQVGNSLVLL
jgi:hypothetical protein